MADALLPEFDHEMGTTRRLLERVPDDAMDWAPHERSMTLGALAAHLVDIPRWTSALIDRDGYDVAADGADRRKAPTGREALLAGFDRHASAARAAIAPVTDAELAAPWTLRDGDTELFTLPKIVALRSFLLNHLIHHRGQLSVYLRLRNIPVPSIYGPSADEGRSRGHAPA
jgi:uncharacterized damage-inducible protein DinB